MVQPSAGGRSPSPDELIEAWRTLADTAGLALEAMRAALAAAWTPALEWLVELQRQHPELLGPPPPPADPRARALDARRRRGTGPAPAPLDGRRSPRGTR